MKHGKKLLALLLCCAGLLTACGKTSEMGEKEMEMMESIAQSVAESVAESVVSSLEEEKQSSAKEVNASVASESNADRSSADQTDHNTAPAFPSDLAGFAGEHGALRVDGASLVDQNGDPIQLYGMSTHGIAWFPQFVCYESFQTLRDDWHTNCVRLAMYTAEYNGYCSGGNQEELKALVKQGVDAATELGMYVIVDWHILSDQDPNEHKDEAIKFFDEISGYYASNTNVLYEICNEPNGYATWDSVKSYAEEVIPVIRANDPDAIIIVGTPTWSQDIDKAKDNPLSYDNVMYAMHFYAGTHKDTLWNRLDSCVQNGLPVFITEFGMCDASGNGANDFESTKSWFQVIEKYNISFCCWNLANKDEASSVFKSSTTSVSNWSEDEMNESGKWIRNYFRSK